MSRLEGVKGLTAPRRPKLGSGEIKGDRIQGFEPRSASELQGRADARGQRSACCWRALLSSPQCARTGNSPPASAREQCAASCPPRGRRETSPPVRVQEVAPRETAGGILRGRKEARSSALGDPAEMLIAPATAVPDTGPTIQIERSVSAQHTSFSHAASANTARASAATQALG